MKTNQANNSTVVQQLNKAMADLQLVYQNLRTAHWLVKGPEFYTLHKLYESFYTETAEVIDQVAERILMLDGTPLHTYSDFLTHSDIVPVSEVEYGKASLKVVFENYSSLLHSFRELIKTASQHEDEGTVALVSELIGSTEKKIWMLKTTLS